MTNYQDVALSPSGAGIPGATITVFVTGTSSKPTIYSDAGVTVLANPFQADGQGRFKFYVANGKYDIQVSGPGIVTQSKTDVLIVDGLQALSQIDRIGLTTSVSATPIVTPTVNSFYAVYMTNTLTTQGTNSITGTVSWTDPDNGAATFVNLTSLNINQVPGATTISEGSSEFYAKAGVPVTYSIDTTGSLGAGVYTVHVRLVQL